MTVDGRLCSYEYPHGPSRGKRCLGDLEQDIHYESPWYDPSTQGVATTHHFQPFERRKGERRAALAAAKPSPTGKDEDRPPLDPLTKAHDDGYMAGMIRGRELEREAAALAVPGDALDVERLKEALSFLHAEVVKESWPSGWEPVPVGDVAAAYRMLGARVTFDAALAPAAAPTEPEG